MQVDIDGISAIGKTTLIQSLSLEFPMAKAVNELLMEKKNPYLSWKTREEYLQKQMWFFDQTLQRYTQFPVSDGEIQINDIGITDVIVHTGIFPMINSLGWSVWELFVKRVKENYPDRNLADLVIYLHAPEEVIRKRQKEDTARVRGAFESNIRLYSSQKKCYERLAEVFPDQVYLVAADGEPKQVKQEVMRIMNGHKKQPLKLYQVLDVLEMTIGYIFDDIG